MFQERLLERIRGRERDPDQRSFGQAGVVVQSVVAHLERLLNTRQGSSPLHEDYGIPDFTNLSGETLSETGTEIERLLRQVIQRYEPRLEGLQVHFDPTLEGVLNLRFRMEGTLKGEKPLPISLETWVSSDGKIAVHS